MLAYVQVVGGEFRCDLGDRKIQRFETPRVDARQRRDLASALSTVLGDVYAAVADWPKMQAIVSGSSVAGAPSE